MSVALALGGPALAAPTPAPGPAAPAKPAPPKAPPAKPAPPKAPPAKPGAAKPGAANPARAKRPLSKAAAAREAAAKRAKALEHHKRAEQLAQDGQLKPAIAALDEALALAPNEPPSLKLKGALQLRLKDLAGAIESYDAFIKVSPPDADRLEAEKIVAILRQRTTTFLEVTVDHGPADVYVDFTTKGRFCQAAPTCKGAVSPGEHKIIVMRSGFERWTGTLSAIVGESAQLTVALIEEPSLLTVRVAQSSAQITLDGAPYDQPLLIPPGAHKISAALAGHETEQIDALAKEGKPLTYDIALRAIVPVKVEPPTAILELDRRIVTLRDGALLLAPGAHTLIVRARGHDDHRLDIAAERPADYTISVKLHRSAVSISRKAIPNAFTLRRKLALTAGGTGLLVGGAGLIFGLSAKQLDSVSRGLCDSPSLPCPDAPRATDLNRHARSRAFVANIAYGAAGAAAVAAAVLWFTSAPEARITVTPNLGPVAGLELTARF